MAKARNNSNPQIKASLAARESEPLWVPGIAALILGILTALALGDYSHLQNPQLHSPVPDTNIVGFFGLQFAYFSLWILGVAAWPIPFLCAWLAYLFLCGHGHRLTWGKAVSLFLLLVSVAVFGSLSQEHFALGEPARQNNNFPSGLGGLTGHYLYNEMLDFFIGKVGTFVVFLVLFLFAFWVLFRDNLLRDLATHLKRGFDNFLQARARKAAAKAAAQEVQTQAVSTRPVPGPVPAPKPPKTMIPINSEDSDDLEPLPKLKQSVANNPVRGVAASIRKTFEPLIDEPPAKSTPSGGVDEGDAITGNGADAHSAKGARLTLPKVAEVPASTGFTSGIKIIESEQTKKAVVPENKVKGEYIFPPYKLLSEPMVVTERDNSEYHRQTAESLIRILDEFGVKVTPGEIHTGPVITRYDVFPAPGVRVEKIMNLDKNLALGLKALSVRILAPVPGKGCVGIEVPNKHPQAVVIRDILESEDWVNTKAEIPIALGKEVSGKPLIADLTKMPHLLIAGSTGSGKTVCINSIITSLLYHASPDDLKFVMVDPKIVEMQVYNSLPHMLVPVVTDPKKVPNALKYLLSQMERRYHLFASVGVRNIAGYNAKMAKTQEDAAAAEQKAAELDAELTPEERLAAASAIEVPRQLEFEDGQPSKLPYIVVIVDELADLMMVAPADIETGIARLAQLARAAGIHLILATQRPSVNVITGVIKANLPSRIAFKVASKVDSRTILDGGGADQLIGRGDMLFLPPGSPELVRSQGAFVGDEEINGIVEFVREHNGEPEFDEIFQRNLEEGDDEDGDAIEGGEYDDDLVPQAIEVIRNSRRASTSMLQRRLKIGYNRAARIMEILEDKGMVGPENGSSPREILMDLD